MSHATFETMELLNPAEIARAAQMFENLKQLRLKLGNGDEQVLERAFELHVQGVLDKLEQRWSEIADPQQRNVEVLMARHGLYDAAFQQVALLCQSISPALGDAVKDLRMLHSTFMMEFHQSSEQYAQAEREMQQRVLDCEEEIARGQDDNERLKEAMLRLNEENEGLNSQILELRRHLRAAASEVSTQRELLATHSGADAVRKNVLPTFDTSLALYGDVPNGTTPRGALSIANSVNNSNLNNNNNNNNANVPNESLRRTTSATSLSLSTASPRYMRSARSSALGAQAFKFEELDLDSVRDAPSQSLPPHTPRTQQSQGPPTPLNTPRRGPLSLRSPTQWLRAFREDVQRAMDSGRCRALTLRETRETMVRVLQSKALADHKAANGLGNVPRETLEQHVFREAEKKYGLRSLAVEHAGMFLLALDRYAPASNAPTSSAVTEGSIAQNNDIPRSTTVNGNGATPTPEEVEEEELLDRLLALGNNDVRAFRAVLRNEVEEAFLSVLRALVRAIRDLAHAQVAARHPNRDAASLRTLVAQRLLGGALAEDEWLEIVHYLYTERDCAVVANLLRLRAIAATGGGRELSSGGGGGGSEKTKTVLLIQGRPATLTRSLSASYTVGVPHSAKHSQAVGGSGASQIIAYDKANVRAQKRLGYSSSTVVTPSPANAQTTRGPTLRLPTSDMVSVVLDFQLESHREYLSVFVKAFRDVDGDTDGVLTQREFAALFQLLRQQQQVHGGAEDERDVVDALVAEMDPFGSDRIPFSVAVVCLSTLQQMESAQPQSH